MILFATDFETHLKSLDTLFEHLSRSGIKLNLSKCSFGQREVKFWGHIVLEAGCRPDPTNVKAVTDMKPPTTVKGVRRFLGMCGFYRKHIPKFAKVSAPLTNLTRKNGEFQWTENCQEAFERLKEQLTEAPVLVRADINQPFVVPTDASNTHVGGVLSQIQADGSNRAIGYFSHKFKAAETRYATTDREALAVVLTCRHFHHYLLGTRFTIITDHQPLTSIFKKKTKSPRMNRWVLEMREYLYNIQYNKGKHNLVEDSLSRPILVIHRPPESTWLGKGEVEMRRLQMEEERWREMVEYLEGDKVPRKQYLRTTLDQFVLWDEVWIT